MGKIVFYNLDIEFVFWVYFEQYLVLNGICCAKVNVCFSSVINNKQSFWSVCKKECTCP